MTAGKAGDNSATAVVPGSKGNPSVSAPAPSEARAPKGPEAAGTPVPAPRHKLGMLVVTSSVPRAKVAVDGRTSPDWLTPFTFRQVPPGVHLITVSKDGYRAANQEVKMEAGGEASLNAILTRKGGEIDILTSPSGAEVLIDGKSYGPGPVRAPVEAGQHTFVVRQAGRETVEGKLEVEDQSVVQRSVALPLKPRPTPATNISVTTQPPSATIYVDGAPVSGHTPLSFHLSPGHHTLIVSAEGHLPLRREVDIPQDGMLTVYLTLSKQ